MNEHKLKENDLIAYREFLYEEERSPATVEKYMRDVGCFVNWLNGRKVSKSTAAEWKGFLLSEGLSPVTVNTRLSAVNGFFRFKEWDECRVKFLSLQRRVFRDESRELSREEYIRLIEFASEQLKLLIETICSTGIRVSEVKYITVQAARNGRADISLKGKIRTVLLPCKLCKKLIKYAEEKNILFGEIFVDRHGNGLSRCKIWRDMKMLCKKAGIDPSKGFPHNLRHLFATTFYCATHDIVRLADILGHSSVETTRIYLLTTGTEHAKQLDKLGLVR